MPRIVSVPKACLAAVRRVLWLEDEIASSPSEDLESLDGAMRVLEAAYVVLERSALRAPRQHPLRLASLRLVGARRVWLAVAADAAPGGEDSEVEACHELDAARASLRETVREHRPTTGRRAARAAAPRPANVVSLEERRLRRSS